MLYFFRKIPKAEFQDVWKYNNSKTCNLGVFWPLPGSRDPYANINRVVSFHCRNGGSGTTSYVTVIYYTPNLCIIPQIHNRNVPDSIVHVRLEVETRGILGSVCQRPCWDSTMHL